MILFLFLRAHARVGAQVACHGSLGRVSAELFPPQEAWRASTLRAGGVG